MKNNIHAIRRSKGITLRDLSLSAGLSVGYLSHLENGTRSNPSLQTMTRICIALGKPLSEVFYI